jgi:hypothetical protein
MSNAEICAIFLIFTILFYLPTICARYRFSGAAFSPLKLWGVMTYNIVCGYYHLKFVAYGTLPSIGEAENSTLGWVSLCMPVIYGLSLPSPKNNS